MIYLDNNATTPLDASVLDAMMPFLKEDYGNPSCSHRAGKRARQALDGARQMVAQLTGAEPADVVFTGSGTEADNLAILGRARRARERRQDHLVITAVEHPAVTSCARYLASNGFSVTRLPVLGDGTLPLETLEESLAERTFLVCAMLANNETGVLFPVREIARICRARGVPLHTDAVNAAGKIPVTLGELGADTIALSAHKFHGPKGVGVLVRRRGVDLEPLTFGGNQEGGVRSGTENVAGAVGLARALELAAAGLPERAETMAALRDRLYKEIRRIYPAARRNGSKSQVLPNTLNVSFPGLAADVLVARLDAGGVAVTAGAACHEGSESISPVLEAMGLPIEVGRGAVRFSLSRFTTAAHIEEALEVIARSVEGLMESARDRSP